MSREDALIEVRKTFNHRYKYCKKENAKFAKKEADTYNSVIERRKDCNLKGKQALNKKYV